MSIVIFDLDGTLSLADHRVHLIKRDPPDWDGFFRACVDDTPNRPAIEFAKALKARGHKIWIWSGRSDLVSCETIYWLHDQGLEFDQLLMRKQGDHTPDRTIKERWLKAYFPDRESKEQLLAVMEDRSRVVDMWRENGISCFQVAPGDF